MNDIHVTFFILLSLFWYVKFYRARETLEIRKNTTRNSNDPTPPVEWYALATGIGLGLAVSSKWSGAFAVGVVGLSELMTIIISLTKKASYKKIQSLVFSPLLRLALIFGLLPLVIYIASYGMMFDQGKTLICQQQEQIQGKCYFERFYSGNKLLYEGYVSHFVSLHKQIWWYQTHLEAEHPYQSRPWQWALNVRPVWYHVDYEDGQRADIYAHGNTLLFWWGLVAVGLSAGWLAYGLIFRKVSSSTLRTTQLSLCFALMSYFAVWLPWQLSPRIMFFYHYTPAVPLLAIILAFWLLRAFESRRQLGVVYKTIAVVALISIGTYFFLWYQHWTGQFVDVEKKNNLYFKLEQWK